MGTFYSDVISKDARFASVKRVNAMELLEPGTRQRVAAIIADAGAMGIELIAFETYRSRERQAALYAEGASQLKKVGTHHYGLACDLVRIVAGEPTWKGDYSFLGHLARAYGLIWGGDWGRPDLPHSFIDVVHVQRCTIARQGALFSEQWYPDAAYDPYADLAPNASLPGPLALAPTQRGRQRGAYRRSAAYALAKREAGLVATPGGFRDPRLVRRADAIVESSAGSPMLIESAVSIKSLDLAAFKAAGSVSLSTSGWVAYCYWSNASGRPLRRFATSWVVPPPPNDRGEQYLYLFNGVQNTGANYGILQPVLQWGVSPFGGGKYWSVASWYVKSDLTATHSPQLVPVEPGQLLSGVIEHTGSSPFGESYACEFAGIPGTRLDVTNVAELTWVVQALEAYGVDSCDDYPTSASLTMSDIELRSDNGSLPLSWTTATQDADCGQRFEILDDSAMNGSVELYFR